MSEPAITPEPEPGSEPVTDALIALPPYDGSITVFREAVFKYPELVILQLPGEVPVTSAASGGWGLVAYIRVISLKPGMSLDVEGHPDARALGYSRSAHAWIATLTCIEEGKFTVT
jgi:hypothetical protein